MLYKLLNFDNKCNWNNCHRQVWRWTQSTLNKCKQWEQKCARNQSVALGIWGAMDLSWCVLQREERGLVYLVWCQPPVILAFWYSWLSGFSSHSEFMAGLCDQENMAEVSTVWLLRVGLKGVGTSALVFRSLALGKSGPHARKTFKQPAGERPTRKDSGFPRQQSAAGCRLGSRRASPGQDLGLTVTSANETVLFSWETPATTTWPKLLLNPWPTEILEDEECWLF